MKETINVNIAQQAFTMDMDAHSALSAYLDDIQRRLPADDTDTLADVESRIAEIFRERVKSPLMVITLRVVRDTMQQIGGAENFGEATRPAADDTTVTYDPPRKFYRSRSNRAIAGVCGGIAQYFDLDPTLVRILAIFGLLFVGGSLWFYLILWLITTYEPQE